MLPRNHCNSNITAPRNKDYEEIFRFQKIKIQKSSNLLANLLKHTFLIFCCILNFNCQDEISQLPNTFKYITPQYDLIEIHPTLDTLRFQLDERTYNSIKSFNLFSHNGTEYISFYDRKSESINIYNFRLQKLVKQIFIKSIISSNKIYRTSVYSKNFDSIFINNNKTLYLVDTLCKIKKSFEFKTNPYVAWAHFKNTIPPVFKDSTLYIGIRPFVKESSLSALKEWKVLYRVNMYKNRMELDYTLPELYKRDIYGYHFLDYSYCYNDKNNIVFSFPADTCIYETDITNFQTSYLGKSKSQINKIKSVTKEELSNSENGFKSYLMRDSYGAIYFDPHAKRYLRVARLKISDEDYQAKNRRKQQHIIIFDSNLKIIGESEITAEASLNSIFFTQDGNIYARIKTKDEYALNFVRLSYFEKGASQNKFVKNNISH